jgi:hypothetical protein
MHSNNPHRRPDQAPLTTGRYSRPIHSDRFTSTATAPAPAEPDLQLETFARSVDCLLPLDGPPSERDEDVLVNLVRTSFPEFLDAKKSLSAAQECQERQVRALGPRLLGNASAIVEASQPDDELDGTIDETAEIIWKLARIDEQIEELARTINQLQQRIMTRVHRQSPASARAVRHALDRA